MEAKLVIVLLIALIVVQVIQIVVDGIVVRRNYRVWDQSLEQQEKKAEHLEGRLKFYKTETRVLKSLASRGFASDAFVIDENGITRLPGDWREKLGAPWNDNGIAKELDSEPTT